MQLSLKIKVPGKLYILGEYNVLKSGQMALSMAIDRFLVVEINDANQFSVSENGKEINLLDQSFKITSQTINLVNEFLKYKNIEIKKYRLQIKNDLKTYNNIKYGLGSSAAIRVGVCLALLSFHDVELTKSELFKLLVLGQIKDDDLTSGGDLATSIYGGYVSYQRYDIDYVKAHYKDDNFDLIFQEWPLLKIKVLNNKNNYFNAIFSGIDDKDGPFDFQLDEDFYQRANIIVKKGISYLEEENLNLLKNEISNYYNLLIEKNHQYELSLKDDHLNKIIEVAKLNNITLKPSGSGRSDSLIYVIDENEKHFLRNLSNIDKMLNLEIGVFHYE